MGQTEENNSLQQVSRMGPLAWTPVVADSAARDALFPTPVGDEKVFNKGTRQLERYDASVSAWVPDVVGAITPQLFGAKGDAIDMVDGAITTGTASFSSASSNFPATAVGKVIVIAGAGAAGVPLVTTILARVSSTQLTLLANASTTVSGAYAAYGTNDSAAVASMVAALKANIGGVGYVPTARYLCTSTVTLDKCPPMKFLGDGAKITTLNGGATELRGSVFINATGGVLFDIVDNSTAGQYQTRGITFDGIGVQQTDGTNDIAFRISASKDKFRFRNGGVRGGKYGVAFTGTLTPFNVKWDNFDFYSMQSGVYIPYWSGSDFLNMQWHDCTLRFCSRYGVEAQAGDSFYFKDNIIEANTLGGLNLAGVFHIGLENNHFEGNGGGGTAHDIDVLGNSGFGGSATPKQTEECGQHLLAGHWADGAVQCRSLLLNGLYE
jgi:hypothetical protein